MAVLNFIRFGPEALRNNLINFPVSYNARNFVINSASLLRRTLIDDVTDIVPVPVTPTQISNLNLASILLRMREEATRRKINAM